MKLFYSTIFVFFIQSCVLYGMETDILYLPQTFDAGILSSVRQLAQDFNTNLKREYISCTGLRKDFEQRNKALLDQVSIDSLQKYLIDLPLEDCDDSVPWLVNYWYDRVQDPHLIQSLSKELMNEDEEEGLEEYYSEAFVIGLDGNTGNNDISKLATLVKKYAYSVKEMYAYNSNSIVIKKDSSVHSIDKVCIKGQYLRTLDGIETIINKKMTYEEKAEVKSIHLQSNKLLFPDVRRIKNLFPNFKKVSYKENPLRYIDEKDCDMPVGVELDFSSIHSFVYIPVEKLSKSSCLNILFNKKSLSDQQIVSLQSLSYAQNRCYCCKRKGFLGLLGVGALANGLGLGSCTIGMSIYNKFELVCYVFPIAILLSSAAAIGFWSESINKGKPLCCSSLYTGHKIVLNE